MTPKERKAVRRYVAALNRAHECDMRFTVAQLRQHTNRSTKAEAACVKADAALEKAAADYEQAMMVDGGEK